MRSAQHGAPVGHRSMRSAMTASFPRAPGQGPPDATARAGPGGPSCPWSSSAARKGTPRRDICAPVTARAFPRSGPAAYAGYALGAIAHNRLSLLYAAVFSAALYGFVLLFASFPTEELHTLFPATTPRRGPAALMLASGVVLLAVWGVPLLTAALTGAAPPGLGPYTTEFTMVLDLAVIAPAAFLAGTLILRRRPLGYLVALSLLVLEISLAPLIIAQTAAQLLAGVRFTIPEVLGPMGGFMLLAGASAVVLVSLLRATDRADGRPAHHIPER